MKRDTLVAWEFDKDIALQVAAQVALDQLEPPDIEVVMLANRGDSITVQVIDGALSDPENILYVARRGLYEVIRTEEWPPVVPGQPSRVLLTLRAWPHR